jgi:signal transduction histidine kinase
MVFDPLVEARTYRALLFIVTGALLSPVWFALLLTAWIALPLLAITPLIVPGVAIFDALMYYGVAAEAWLARTLLGRDVQASRRPPRRTSYWGTAGRILADGRFWKRQVFLVERCVLGFGLGVAAVTGLAVALGLLFAPTYYWTSDSVVDVGFWAADTWQRALLLVPIGFAALVLWTHLVRAAAAMQAALARKLLSSAADADSSPAVVRSRRRRAVATHAGVFVALNAILVLIWALTTRGYFWPIWPLLALGFVLAVHAWVVQVLEQPELTFAGSRSLTIFVGVATALFILEIGIWAVTGRGYFWPIWSLVGNAVIVLIWVAAVRITSQERAALTERIDELTTTRAGAVDASEAGLQRIERDLHDGAQARLVALGMNLGMAEQKLEADPEGARALVAEAREGLGEALRELRNLARGIRPPILADRGLEAAVAGLAASSPIRVDVVARVEARPAAPVETAAYFVVAEALANASKHAHAEHVKVSIVRDVTRLSVEVTDDGTGGADQHGNGLTGLRQRVEALDGVLTVDSPTGGPTTIRAVLPCGS